MATAFVTGASSGIGRAIALELAGAGHAVTAVARREAALAALAAENPAITPLALDLTDDAALAAALAGREIDILVNNAGMIPPLGPFRDTDPADTARALQVNLASVLTVTRHVVPGMQARGRGHVIFTGSASAHAVFANMAVYSATKAAIAQFAACLRTELSADGIRVTEIVPGRVETHLYDDIIDEAGRKAMYSTEVVQPEDVARMVGAVVALPEWATVTRFDIMPTRPTASSRR